MTDRPVEELRAAAEMLRTATFRGAMTATRVMPHPLAADALTVARAILPDDSRSTT